MRITGLDVFAVRMPLDEPYEVAYEAVTAAENVFVRLKTDGGFHGVGCAAPDLEVTGERPEGVIEWLGGTAEPALLGEDPLRRALLLERLAPWRAANPAAVAAVDMALFDLLGRVAGQPVHVLLGGFRTCMATSITVGILPEAETVEAARRRVAGGFTVLKLKGGRDVDDDISRVMAVRAAVGPDVALRFDANQGYDMAGARRFVDGTRAAALELLEQPTPRDQPDLLGRVTAAVALPVMADESLMTLMDAFHLARGERADMVNVKLMKVGGISQALLVNGLATSAGLEVMVGCMDESALAIAAGLHFALARPNCEYADLDGHIGLQGDPAASAVRLDRGVLYPQDRPGFGVELP